MRVSTKVTTKPRHKAITKQYEQQARGAVESACQHIRGIAVQEISGGSRTGREYKRGGKIHTASAA